jgi:hypothetical protein
LQTVRVVDDTAFNAHAAYDSATSFNRVKLIKNRSSYESMSFPANADSAAQWYAKYPGELGNALEISVCPSFGDSETNANFTAWKYSGQFDGAPTTSQWATAQNTDSATFSHDEIHIVVADRTGAITGQAGTVLETFPYVSVAKGAKLTDGSTNYFKDVINRASSWVWYGGDVDFDSDGGRVVGILGSFWGATPNVDNGGDTIDYKTGVTSIVTLGFGGGADGTDPGKDEYQQGFDLMQDPDETQVDFLIAPDESAQVDHVATVNYLTQIAETRKDCVVVCSPPREAVVNNGTNTNADVIAFGRAVNSSSYLIVDNNYGYMYDKFNDQFIYIPCASSTAGIIAASDLARAPWFSPAGFKRGGPYRGITQLAYSPTKVQRDDLYKVGINPIVNFAGGTGITLFGDKTKQGRPSSAFDRINVRRLFIVLERAIAEAAKNVMFEFNDEFTRSEFVSIIEPVLRDVKGRRGITDFVVQCDENNNPPAVVDRNELIASIFIKPARSINYITLNFVAVRTGIDFEEVVGTV